MSDTDNTPPEPQTPPEQTPVPPQQAPDDTSNWDNRVSTDPSGDTYIKEVGGDQIQTK